MTETPEQRAASVEAVRFARREACRDVVAELEAENARLRVILAPLLDGPFTNGERYCVLCHHDYTNWDSPNDRDGTEHHPDCPVLRKGALLGEGG